MRTVASANATSLARSTRACNGPVIKQVFCDRYLDAPKVAELLGPLVGMRNGVFERRGHGRIVRRMSPLGARVETVRSQPREPPRGATGATPETAPTGRACIGRASQDRAAPPGQAARDGEIALRIKHERRLGDAVDIGAAADELDQIDVRQRRGKLQIGRHAQRRVPAMPDILHAEIIGHPGDPPLLADAADLGDVGLHDIERAARQPGQERLPPRQHLAARDRHPAGAAQMAEIVDCIGPQRFLEPANS